MTSMIGDSRFDDDPKSGRNQSLSYHAQSFVENWYNFPVKILFSVLETAAPVLMTLSRSSDVPVGSLALCGAVSSPLTAITKLSGDITNFKAKGAVPSV